MAIIVFTLPIFMAEQSVIISSLQKRSQLAPNIFSKFIAPPLKMLPHFLFASLVFLPIIFSRKF